MKKEPEIFKAAKKLNVTYGEAKARFLIAENIAREIIKKMKA